MSKIILWIVFARWVLASTAREMRCGYQLKYKYCRDARDFYFSLVQNNFCGSRNSEFIRRDMLRILNIREDIDG